MNQIEIYSKHSNNEQLENILTNLEEHPVMVAYGIWERVSQKGTSHQNFSEFLKDKHPDSVVVDLASESIAHKKIFT